MNDQEKTKQQLVEEVAELRQNLDALVNYLPEGFFIVDAPDANIRLANRESREALGVSRGELEGVRDTGHFDYYKVFRPDGSPVDVKQLPLARALAAGEVIRNEEWLFQTMDGRRVPILCHAGPVRDQQGAIRGAVISWQDISDRKQAEEALRKAHDELEERVKERTAELQEANERLHQEVEERRRAETALRQSEERYKTLVEMSPDAVLMIDLKQNIIFASQQAVQLFGYDTVEEFCGLPVVTSLVADEGIQRLTANLALLARQGVRRQIEYIGVRRDSSRFLAEVSSAVLRDDRGEPKAFMAVVRDVTERKQAEEALRASTERYELAVRGAGVGLWDWDIRTGKLYFSPRWKAIFGYGEKDIGESVEDWAGLLHPDEKDWMLKFLDDFLAGTSSTVTVEYRLRHKDGSYRWIVAHGLVLRDEQGKAYRFVGSHGDITDRKQAEEALLREHRTLKHLLQSSDHERQLIAYELHDELAQQLAGAIMQFQTFNHLKETRPKEAAKAYDAGMTMLQQGHVETRRLIAGVRPPILDEDGVVAAIGHLVNEHSRLKGPEIDYHSRVRFDRLAPILENGIYRIAQEGLANACQHSKSERVRVGLMQRDDKIQIDIRDWGIGFDTRSAKENHFGLEGIRQRARLLGGKCSIQSKAGKGTRILVELPVVERE